MTHRLEFVEKQIFRRTSNISHVFLRIRRKVPLTGQPAVDRPSIGLRTTLDTRLHADPSLAVVHGGIVAVQGCVRAWSTRQTAHRRQRRVPCRRRTRPPRMGADADATRRTAHRRSRAASETGKMISVQVKTGTTNVFRLSHKDERVGPATAQWYVLVRLGGVGSRPDFYVVPALVIAALVYVDHRRWLEQPSSRTGEARKDTAIRACKSARNRLLSGAVGAPARRPGKRALHLPDWAHTLGNGRIGWPPDHPGFRQTAADLPRLGERPMHARWVTAACDTMEAAAESPPSDRESSISSKLGTSMRTRPPCPAAVAHLMAAWSARCPASRLGLAQVRIRC